MVDELKWRIVFQKSAYKEYQKLPQQICQKVDKVFKTLISDPFDKTLDLKRIRGKQNYYRVRIGNYRIVYQVKESILLILIIRVGHRKDIYRFFQ